MFSRRWPRRRVARGLGEGAINEARVCGGPFSPGLIRLTYPSDLHDFSGLSRAVNQLHLAKIIRGGRPGAQSCDGGVVSALAVEGK